MRTGKGWVGKMGISAACFALFLIGEAPGSQDLGTLKGTVKVHRARHSGDTIVYLEAEGAKPSPPPEEHPQMDQKNLIFTPHILPIQKGTTVDFPNSDKVRHNVFAPPKEPNPFNLGTYGEGVTKSVTFDGIGETLLLCNVHAEMSAYVVVLPSPYFATTDRNGNFSIQGVPPGRYTLKTWHEKRHPVSQEVQIPTGGTTEVQVELTKRR